jgi:uncharacterized protein YjbJ (UPF0337 family)
MSKETGPKAAVDGVIEDAKGRVKEVAGRVSGNDRLEEEGQAQQDKAANQREVAKHEAEADAARGKAKADEAREQAAQR